MNKFLKGVAVSVAGLSVAVITGCANDGDGSGTGSSNVSATVSQALTIASTKVQAVVPDTSSIATSSLTSLTSINSEWTDSNYALGGNYGNSPRNFVRNQGDATSNSNLMYRLNQVIQNLCLFSTALPSTNNVIDLNTGSTVTLTAAVKQNLSSTCNVALAELPPDDTVVGYRVEDISAVSGTEYDRRISFDMAGGTSYTDFFYYTLGTTTKMAYMEDGSNDSLALFQYNSLTGMGLFEFSETDGTRVNHYRVALDENSDLGIFTAYVNNGTDVSSAVVSVVEGGSTQLAVSYSFDDNANTHDLTDGNACISNTDFSVATDNSLACNGVTGSAVSTFTADLSGINTGYITGIDNTTNIQFTGLSDVLTAATAR